jgi:hypothetical protein
MEALHGLRLNCWLAPMCVVAVGVGVLVWYHQTVSAGIRSAHEDSLRTVQQAYARLEERGSRPSLEDALQADRRWTCLAEIRFTQDDHAEILRIAGSPPELDLAAPPPELTLAVAEQQLWTTPAGAVAVATALRGTHAGGPTHVLYGQARLTDAGPAPALWTAIIVLVLAGGGLGWYLARRIWRPIEALAADAEAALRGEGPRPLMASSETKGVRSSLVTLVERYRSLKPGDSETTPTRTSGQAGG